jgi:hypothetical protein
MEASKAPPRPLAGTRRDEASNAGARDQRIVVDARVPSNELRQQLAVVADVIAAGIVRQLVGGRSR